MPLWSQIFSLVPELKTHSSGADGLQTAAVVHSKTLTACPKKIGLSHKQAIEVLTIIILSFTLQDQETARETDTYILSHRLASQQRISAA